MSKAGKKQDRFKFTFNKCILITYHVLYTVLGIVYCDEQFYPRLEEITI